jgi:replicative DNA helicase
VDNTAAVSERAVLGSLIRDNRHIAEVAVELAADDFYADAHQKIYAAVLVLFDQGKAADLVTVANLLHGKGQIEDIRYPYLAELLDAAPVAGNVMHYARIVAEHAIYRAVLHAGQEIAELGARPTKPADELLGHVEQIIFAIANRRRHSDVVTLRQAIEEAYERLDLMHQRGSGGAGVLTRLADLDNITGGLHAGELIVIAARPSIGKTSLALAIARHVAQAGHAVFFVSLEQGRQDLADRLICAEGQFDHQQVRKGMLNAAEWEQIRAIGSELQSLPIHIDDGAPQGMLRIAANARRLKSQHQIGLVIVDYLQMVEAQDAKETRQEQVAGVARRLKQLAKELGIPLVALAQLNRQPEGRQDRRPRLADLRESGAIEADADTVLLMHRPDEQDKSRIEVLVEKQRNGPTGEFTLAFRPACMRFENYAPDSWAT